MNILRILFLLILAIIIITFARYKTRKSKTITIGFGGDTMIGRLVNDIIPKTSYLYPWGNILPLLRSTNVNIVNLETTLTKSIKKIPKVFNYKSDPLNVAILQKGNIGVVSLANNHILDFGIEGLQETLNALDKARIKHVGAGMNMAQAKKPVIINNNGIKIGIIGYTDNEPNWKAGPERPGTNYLKVGDIQTIINDISTFKDNVDLVILSYHWGPNMRQRPTPEFRTFAHQIIDAGVDIIHGHSAHIFQGIEIYDGKVIMYDTGDFIDDYAVDPQLRNDQSFFFMLSASKQQATVTIDSLKLVPLIIGNLQVNKATGNTKKEILIKMQLLSAELGTTVSDEGVVTINSSSK